VPAAEPRRILIADDEPNLRRVLGAILEREGYEVLVATDGVEALDSISQRVVHTVITDLRMPKLDGIGLLRRVCADYPDVPVIILTAHGTVDSAVEAVKLGAFDYIEKPFEQEEIRQIVAKAVRTWELHRREITERQEGRGRYGLIGESAPMAAVYAIIERVADTPSTVLITGESGTGKELVAKALHENSARRSGPFIKINCAAIPKTLMESELFGYEKGAFTGAVGSKPGRFELADKGTLFLDEIGEIPIEMQVKLLRVLQDSEFERVGGVRTLKVDVRLITATNRDLQKEIEGGAFRDDLFYRLNVVPVQLPPLRDRRSDVPLLIDHFIEKFNARLRKRIGGVEDDALEALCAYHWPGNIRELENVIERSLLFSSGPLIRLRELPAEVTAAAPARPSDMAVETSLKAIVRAETERLERDVIRRALDETGWNVTRAARKLKISRKSLQVKMKELGLREAQPPEDKEDK
jgi:DNA-binding NtrC family response regulator